MQEAVRCLVEAKADESWNQICVGDTGETGDYDVVVFRNTFCASDGFLLLSNGGRDDIPIILAFSYLKLLLYLYWTRVCNK